MKIYITCSAGSHIGQWHVLLEAGNQSHSSGILIFRVGEYQCLVKVKFVQIKFSLDKNIKSKPLPLFSKWTLN